MVTLRNDKTMPAEHYLISNGIDKVELTSSQNHTPSAFPIDVLRKRTKGAVTYVVP